MPTPGTFEALKSAKTIGSANLSAWSSGFNANEYLNVLPNPDIDLIMNDGWSQWQKAGFQKHQVVVVIIQAGGQVKHLM
jgi:hypothetical protein